VTSARAEFCVVGAGPAGLVLANELGRAGREVVLVESGHAGPDASVQELNRGRIVGDPYADLRSVRHRQLGGTVHVWNTEIRSREASGSTAAKYLPLDPIDFEARPEAGLPGWPFGYAELLPFYEAAQRVCGLGPFEYGADEAGLRFAGSGLETRRYQLGPASAFSGVLVDAVRGRPSVSIECGATAAQLRIDASGARASAVVVRDSRTGEERILRAETIVLATGAIENARLLLATDGIGVGRWLGRGFMEHPRDYAMRWHPRHPSRLRELGFLDQHEADGGATVLGRLAVDEATLRERALPQASVTLLPQFRSRAPWWRRLARRAGLAEPSRYPRGGAGWSRGFEEDDLAFVQLLLNLEQAPHPDNRVSLPPPGASRLEGPVRLDWRWRPEDQQRLETVRRVVAEAFEGALPGDIEIDGRARPDPNAHHHAGTTRMSDDPGDGVVDRHGRVHALENVYCAGASVFPSAGFANPTLTIVALSLRLGEHLTGPRG